jgi:hypothetical protein
MRSLGYEDNNQLTRLCLFRHLAAGVSRCFHVSRCSVRALYLYLFVLWAQHFLRLPQRPYFANLGCHFSSAYSLWEPVREAPCICRFG